MSLFMTTHLAELAGCAKTLALVFFVEKKKNIWLEVPTPYPGLLQAEGRVGNKCFSGFLQWAR